MSCPQITFIVPMYNMEMYIEKCIQGILMQSVESMEIIIVDDGSTDNSVEIAQKYMQKYDFIKIVEKENEGISSARNRGIAEATGEYICFIDSDDFYHMDFANEFYTLCKKWDLDIIRGLYEIYDEETKEYLPHAIPNIDFYGECLSGQAFLKKTVQQKSNEVVPWLGFFRREYLNDNKLKFPEGISYEEDQLFFLDALLCCEECKILQSNISFYSYRKRKGSATKTPTYKQAQDVIFIVKEELKLFDKYELNSAMRKIAKRYVCSSFYQLTSIYGRVNKDDKKKIACLPMRGIEFSCLLNPYDRHQFFKILLFSISPSIVGIIYKLKGLK